MAEKNIKSWLRGDALFYSDNECETNRSFDGDSEQELSDGAPEQVVICADDDEIVNPNFFDSNFDVFNNAVVDTTASTSTDNSEVDPTSEDTMEKFTSVLRQVEKEILADKKNDTPEMGAQKAKRKEYLRTHWLKRGVSNSKIDDAIANTCTRVCFPRSKHSRPCVNPKFKKGMCYYHSRKTNRFHCLRFRRPNKNEFQVRVIKVQN